MNFSISERSKTISKYDALFLFLIVVCTVAIVFSYPMMKLRYDVWDHVYRIREMVLDTTATSPSKRYWYACWAFLFKLFNVNDILTIAIVVHRVQFVANCALIYAAAKQLFEPLLSLNKHDRLQNQWLSSLALSSVFIWLLSIGTFSFIQQAWIMWYSVNYQITLSFLLLSIALFVNLLTIKHSKNLFFIKIFIAIALLIFVLLFHAGELAYFIFYLPMFFICFMGNFHINKKYLSISIILTIMILYLGIKFYKDQTPMLLTLIKKNDWQTMVSLIDQKGIWNVVKGGNRYDGSWNEMYRFNVYILLGITGLFCFNLVKIHKRVLSFVVLSLIFCFAPSYIFSAGFLSLVSYDGIVNRYYFASLLFLSLPLCIYLIINKIKFLNYPVYIILITIAAVVVIYFYSKNYNNQGVFYQNFKSIAISLKAKKLDIEVSDFDLIDIKKQIQIAETKAKVDDFIYCGSYKKIYMVAYLYNRKNVYFDRLRDITINECEENAIKIDKYVIYIQ